MLSKPTYFFQQYYSDNNNNGNGSFHVKMLDANSAYGLDLILSVNKGKKSEPEEILEHIAQDLKKPKDQRDDDSDIFIELLAFPTEEYSGFPDNLGEVHPQASIYRNDVNTGDSAHDLPLVFASNAVGTASAVLQVFHDNLHITKDGSTAYIDGVEELDGDIERLEVDSKIIKAFHIAKIILDEHPNNPANKNLLATKL